MPPNVHLMVIAGDCVATAVRVITRDDGMHQWALKGKPLYLYKSDTKPGDMNGDNFKNIWHVAKP